MKELLRKYRILLDRGQKKKLVFIFFMMVIGALLDTLGVSMMVPFISVIINPEIFTTNVIIGNICTFLHITSSRSFIISCLIVFILVFVIKDLFLLMQVRIQASFVATNKFLLQQRVLDIMLHKPYFFFLSAKTSVLQRMVYMDISLAFTLLSSILLAVSEGVVTILLGIAIFVMDWKMTLIVVGVLMITGFIIVSCVRPVIKRAGVENMTCTSQSTKWLHAGIAGIKEIKVYRREQFFEDYFATYGKRLVKTEKVSSISQNIPRLLIEMSCICTMMIYLSIMVLNNHSMESMIPIVGAFAMAAVRLMPSANRIVGALNNVSYTMPSLTVLTEFIESSEKDAHNDFASGKLECKTPLKDEIRFEDITFSYSDTIPPVLKNANLIIPAGKSVGIVGASGSGKTTSVDILLGLLCPQEGRILIDDEDISTRYNEWINNVGYIPQTIFMMDGSIKDNIAFAAECDDESKIWSALEKACLDDFVRSLPDGIETQIGERGVRLSGGQRQRIGIARALYNDPDVLIFDEATSALDNETEAAIMSSIEHLHGTKTMIIIAHRLQTIQKCDLVYRVENGKIELEKEG